VILLATIHAALIQLFTHSWEVRCCTSSDQAFGAQLDSETVM